MNIKFMMIFLFVFLNFYNPISVYFTLFINIIMSLFIMVSNASHIARFNRYIVATTFFILMWTMVIMILRSNIDTFVLGKYLRVMSSTILIAIICVKLRVTTKQLVDVLTVVFVIHILSIAMQTIFPQLDVPMAKIFGFNRDFDIVSRFITRKLGCSSSYDTASLISVSSMLFFFIRYMSKNKNVYIFIAFLSFLACTRSSRMGMVMGLVLSISFGFVFFVKSRGFKRIVVSLIILCLIIFSVYVTLPIFAHSTDSIYLGAKYDNNIISTQDYGTTGTLDSLTGAQLEPMKAPILDLFIGFGIDPNAMHNRSTDIGYVKLIYHIGFIGLISILLLYFYIIRKTIKIKKISHVMSNRYMLSSFLILYVLLIVVMNYKALVMYSRGIHDLLLIIFFVLQNNYSNNNGQYITQGKHHSGPLLCCREQTINNGF